MAPAFSPSVAITYVPADCGSVLPGKSKAPAAFREVDIAGKLRNAGVSTVVEYEALDSAAQYSLTPIPTNGVRNEELNVSTCERVRDSVLKSLTTTSTSTSTSNPVSASAAGTSTSTSISDSSSNSLSASANEISSDATTTPAPPRPPFQLVLGGECGMLPGILTAFWHQPQRPRVGLIYIDADTDLATPADPSFAGTFASMNMTHLLRTPGALPSMSQFTRPDPTNPPTNSSPIPTSTSTMTTSSGLPLCSPSTTIFFSTNMSLQTNTRAHFTYLFDNDFKLISATSVAKEPEARARNALNYLIEEKGVDVVVVHLDVDAIDPRNFPLANLPNFTGVGFEEMMRALKVLVGHEKVRGLVVAEVNPDHDPGLEMVGRLSEGIVGILGGRGR